MGDEEQAAAAVVETWARRRCGAVLLASEIRSSGRLKDHPQFDRALAVADGGRHQFADHEFTDREFGG
ncbi:hypothetical protein ACFWIJ_35565 [Streptomyces sp. NPDC127079]|uniref:hypothetical protein n=1 Tax=Streptomyces sp. NPDC127079 TaxID=3347132 RepID=UPI003662B4A5